MPHTPGPWTFVPMKGAGPAGHVCAATPGLGQVVATVMIAGGDGTSNARLIAAAPDMEKEIERLRGINADLLAALKGLHAANPLDDPAGYARAMMTALDAIDVAEGRA